MTRTEHIAEGVTLHLGDCRKILPTLGKVDAVVSDVPYGIDHKVERTGASKKWAHRTNERIQGDALPFDPSPWVEHPAILWGANHYANRLPASGGWLVFD